MDYADLINRFTFHPASAEQGARYDIIRKGGLSFAEDIKALAPDSRELSLAVTKIEEAVFWANAAIARNA